MNPARGHGGWLLGVLVLLAGAQLWEVRSQREELAQLRTLVETQDRSPPPVAQPSHQSAQRYAFSPAELEAIGRSVTWTAPAPSLVGPDVIEAPAAGAEPDPAQAAALEQARALVEDSLSTGTLRREDVLALRRIKASVGATPGYGALLTQLVLAINAQRLTPEDPDFPLP